MVKKNIFKPVFKQIAKLRINISYNLKLLNFKKKKWKNLLNFSRNQLKKTRYKKYKIIDQNKHTINKKNRLEIGYKNRHFKKLFFYSKMFNFFFGKFSKNYYKILRKKIKLKLKKHKILNMKHFLLKTVEQRLDFILYQSKFCDTIRSAQQLISHGHIIVNNQIIKIRSFQLRSGDIIKLNPLLFKKYNLNLTNSNSWPLLPKNLIINYKTFEIVFVGNFINEINSTLNYLFHFKLHKFLIKPWL